MVERTLVTGGAGFIGSHLVDNLVKRGAAVTVLDDFSTGRMSNLADACASGDVEVVDGSILDDAALERALTSCSRVFHLAVQCVRRSLSRPLENHEINATGTLRVLEASRRRKIRRFIYCSSSEVYGNTSLGRLSEDTSICEPTTVYGAAKLAGEHYTKAYTRTYGLPAIIVRPFNAYGPREHDQGDLAEVIPRFTIRILNGLPPIIFGDGSQGRDFTYVTETAAGLAAVADCDRLIGREVNIAFGSMVTIREVAEVIARVCQRRDLTPTRASERPGDVHALHADISRAQKELNFVPTISFAQGIEQYLQWFHLTYPDPSVLLEKDTINWAMPDDDKSKGLA
jgi:UDP-glucose 4-epimerase